MSFKEELLEIIKDLGAMTVDYAVSPYELKRRLKIANKYGISYRSPYVALGRLEKRGLVKKKKRGGYVKYAITEAGKNLLAKRVPLKKRHDGFSTVVIFDIPEDKHGARDTFRRYLITKGFIALQKSVFLGPYYLSTQTTELARELKINSFITVLSAKIDRGYI